MGVQTCALPIFNEAVDVALRFGLLHDSSMMARKLGTSARMMVASPAYLERAGTPRMPADLSSHMLILGPSGMGPDAWVFRSDRTGVEQGKSVAVRIELAWDRRIKKKNEILQ